jgi:two-component system sensor histidine kinase UhpB
MPPLWKAFVGNAVVLVVATLLLVLTPVTVSFPVALTEVVVLAAGLVAMLGLHLALLRRAFAPLERLRRVMGAVDPLKPGARAAVGDADPEVAELARAFNDMLARLEQERRESARVALAAEEGERLRIARELHDEVGQALTAIVLQLERAARETGSADVVEAREGVRTTVEEVREIARRLRPEALDDLGLGSALAALTLDLSRRTGLRVERRVGRGLPALDPEEELVVYRVAQEALTNCRKHARARQVLITVSYMHNLVTLNVQDDGVGFDPARLRPHSREQDDGGFGLTGMRERVEQLRGALMVESNPGEGCTLMAAVPVAAGGRADEDAEAMESDSPPRGKTR